MKWLRSCSGRLIDVGLSYCYADELRPFRHHPDIRGKNKGQREFLLFASIIGIIVVRQQLPPRRSPGLGGGPPRIFRPRQKPRAKPARRGRPCARNTRRRPPAQERRRRRRAARSACPGRITATGVRSSRRGHTVAAPYRATKSYRRRDARFTITTTHRIIYIYIMCVFIIPYVLLQL
uniref:Uncharacterized protein n=1 Tax=Schizaphis graminum TaxID=13262 RepID=A0A2S2NXE6_SCHGA